jgi:cobalt-zinc-cadmium efflux system membrane fusion protein
MIKQTQIMMALTLISLFNPLQAEEEQVDISSIDTEQQKAMGIISAKVTYKNLIQRLIVPGEVWVNAYKSSQITTRIQAQILQRHAKMGDKVIIGQKLITLTSVLMAEAQGELFIADREWQRVKKLGRQVVSEQRYIKTQVTRQQAYAKVLAYGMTDKQVNNLLLKNNASKATGVFDLLSVQEGVIISDDFISGQVVESGQILMEVSDESLVWVEAMVSPNDVGEIKIGTQADIYTNNELTLKGEVIQIHHKMDETTRTLSVRVAVTNDPYILHPGQFVKTALHLSMGKKVLAIPKSSILLLQGHQTVFQLKNNQLHPQLVETGDVRDGWVEIKNGLQAGDNIVTEKMFLLKSLLLKSQIGDSD